MPCIPLPEIRLRAAGVVPPIVMLDAPLLSWMPKSVLPWATVPVGSVPMKLPSIVIPATPETRIPAHLPRLIARPRTTLLPLPGAKKRTAASLPVPAFVPSISIRMTALVP